MCKIKLLGLFLTAFLCLSSLFGKVSVIDSLEDNFTFSSRYVSTAEQSSKSKYIKKGDGSVWLISDAFNWPQFNYLVANEFYAHFLGDRNLPELAIITDASNNVHLGVKFLEGYANLVDFFGGDSDENIETIIKLQKGVMTRDEMDPQRTQKSRLMLERVDGCFPTGCVIPDWNTDTQQERVVIIHNAELLLALMLLIGDIDGSELNIGLISTGIPNTYTATKVDHEDALSVLMGSMSLALLGKVTLGEGHNLDIAFDYKKFDPNQLAHAFNSLALSQMSTVNYLQYQERMENVITLLRVNVVGKSEESLLASSAGFDATVYPLMNLIEERLVKSTEFAQGLRIEAVLRNGTLEELMALNLDFNKDYESLFIRQIDTLKTRGFSFLDVFRALSEGVQEAMDIVLKIAEAEKPLTPLSMAVYYNMPWHFIQAIAERSNAATIQQAIEVANTQNQLSMAKKLKKLLNSRSRDHDEL